MNNPDDTLNTLWEMSEQGTKEWWPDRLKLYNYIEGPAWAYQCSSGGWLSLEPQHALDLVAASCERWLDEQGWYIYADVCTGPAWVPEDGHPNTRYSLTEAIEYAQQQ